jgi:hypothetical protein
MRAFERSESQLGERKRVDLVRQDADGNTLEQIAIVRDLFGRVTLIKEQSPHLATLSMWYVSNEVG